MIGQERTPGSEGTSPLGVVTALVLGTILAGLFFVARTPGPPLDPAILAIEALHNSMLPQRTPNSGPNETAPLLVSSVESQGGGQLTSWAYLLAGERVTVHRSEADIELPANVQVLGLDGARVRVFESRDLTFLTWTDAPNRRHFVVGSAPVAKLDEVGRWFREERGPSSSGSRDEPAPIAPSEND